MPSQINPGTLNTQFPVPGVNNSSSIFLQNWLSIFNNFSQAVVELTDLDNKVIVSSPLIYGANTNINNFGGMLNSNLVLFDFALVTGNIVASYANSVPSLNFSNSSVANIQITASSPVTQTINISNFPALGYSEMKLIVSASTPPQFLNFSNLVSGGITYGGSKISNFNANTGNFALTDSNPHLITVGSTDGQNWFINTPSTSVARTSAPSSSIGSPGDSAGMIAIGNGNVYICNNNYDGSTHIWQYATLSSF